MVAASLHLTPWTRQLVLSELFKGPLTSSELGLFLRRAIYTQDDDPLAVSYAGCAISVIISREQERDQRWFELTTGHLDISALVLRNYLVNGDSVLLANCIHTVRYLIDLYTKEGWVHRFGSKSKTLESVTKFDIRRTLPRLQHDFCDLWNETVNKAQNPEAYHISLICVLSLRHLRNAYILLHEGTDAVPTAFSAYTDIDDPILDEPSSYPLCTINSHRHTPLPDPTANTPNIAATATEDTITAPPTVVVLPSDVVGTTDPSSGEPDFHPSSSSNAPIPFENFSVSLPIASQPALSILVSPEVHLPDGYPADSTPRIHGVITGVVEDTTGTSTFLSVTNVVAPSSISALSSAAPTDPQSDVSTPTYPSTSVAVSSLIAPQVTPIPDPQAVSTAATFDTHQHAPDFTTPAEPNPQPANASPPPGIASEPVPPFHDAGSLSQGSVGVRTTAEPLHPVNLLP
jgi:hypothetical protein